MPTPETSSELGTPQTSSSARSRGDGSRTSQGRRDEHPAAGARSGLETHTELDQVLVMVEGAGLVVLERHDGDRHPGTFGTGSRRAPSTERSRTAGNGGPAGSTAVYTPRAAAPAAGHHPSDEGRRPTSKRGRPPVRFARRHHLASWRPAERPDVSPCARGSGGRCPACRRRTRTWRGRPTGQERWP